MNNIFELNKIKSVLQIFIENKKDYKDFSNKKLKQEFLSLEKIDSEDKILKFFYLVDEAIFRTYNYNLKKSDLDILEKFLDKTCLNVSSYNEVFFAYLLYSLITYFKEESFYSIFMNRFLLIDYYIKSKNLYEFLKIDSMINLSTFYYSTLVSELKYKKEQTYKPGIVFTSYEDIMFDYIYNENQKENILDIRFDNAFIFDIDKILFDLNECTFRVSDLELEKNSIKIKDFYKKYNNIIGIAKGLFLKTEKEIKKQGLKVENLSSNNEILDYLKEPKDLYYPNRKEKLDKLIEDIVELNRQNKTTIVDVDNELDLDYIVNNLKDKKVDFLNINLDTFQNATQAISLLEQSQITVLSNLMGMFLSPTTEDNSEYRAKVKKHCSNFGYNFENKKDIQNKKINSRENIYLLFASHYLEIENEFQIINNYIKNLYIENIVFYNCPEDDLFKKFHLNHVKIPSEMDENIYKMIFSFLYNLKKRAFSKSKLCDNSFLIYSVKYNNKMGLIESSKILKLQENDLCYCGSNKKYKKCCGKRNNKCQIIC